MKIHDLYKTGKPVISFEFFPPKNEDGEKRLFEAVSVLKPLNPSFVSVTYGAMGSTRSNTLRIVDTIRNTIGMECAAHLACIGHSEEEIQALLDQLVLLGIENVVALRGDLPPGGNHDIRRDAFRYASDLVRYIRAKPQFSSSLSIAVGGYPEGHIECPDPDQDLEHLKIKVDAGADVILTQLFFVNESYFRFVDRARKIGIRVQIVPGIMPVTHGPQIERFAKTCGATIPSALREAIRKFGEDQASVEEFGIEFATRQCEELLRAGAPGLHFYTLNKSHATREIYQNLNLSDKKAGR